MCISSATEPLCVLPPSCASTLLECHRVAEPRSLAAILGPRPVIWLLSILALFSLAALAGAAYQLVGVRRDRRRFPPPGRMLSVSGTSIHVNAAGPRDPLSGARAVGAAALVGELSRPPTIVLESGIAASSVNWTDVHRRISEFARVVSYDRPGFGWSEPDRTPPLPFALARRLHDVLAAADEHPPYILVGHSFGGMIVRAFAALYPDEVVGMLLLDALHPAEWFQPGHERRRMIVGGAFIARVGAALASLGVVRACLSLLTRGSNRPGKVVTRAFGSETSRAVHRVVGEVAKMPRSTWPAVASHWSRRAPFLTMARYFRWLPRASAEMMHSPSAAPAFRTRRQPTAPNVGNEAQSQVESRTVQSGAPNECDLSVQCDAYRAAFPTLVLSSSRANPQLQAWQRDLALNCGAVQTFVPGCGHWVHLDAPDAVVAAIRQLIEAHRAERINA
jgi:pimeloyl-ACP methyl ester carboxylesterase